MKLHSWSAAKMGDMSTVFRTKPVDTSTSYRSAHPATPGVHVMVFDAAMATQRWLPSQAKAPPCFSSCSVFSKMPFVVVWKMSAVQSHGSEYQRFVPSNATPMGQ